VLRGVERIQYRQGIESASDVRFSITKANSIESVVKQLQTLPLQQTNEK